MVTIGVVAATTQPVDPSKGALTAANNLHVVSMAILAYEYVARTFLFDSSCNPQLAQLSHHTPRRISVIQDSK